MRDLVTGIRWHHRVDGTKLVAVQYYGRYIYTSTDSGVTWTLQANAGSGYWYSVVSSSDGTKLVAVQSNNGYIYTSTDSGVTYMDPANIGWVW